MKQKVAGFVLTRPAGLVLLAMAALLGPQPASAATGYDPAKLEAIKGARAAMATANLQRDAKIREQVSDPQNVVPTDQLSSLFKGMSSSLTYAQSPLSMGQGFSGGMMSGLNSMMSMLGGFGSGGMQSPPKNGNKKSSMNEDAGETGNGCTVAATPAAASTSGQPVNSDGKILATPIASLLATPIAGGSSSVTCPPQSYKGQQVTACDQSSYTAQNRDGGVESKKSPTSPTSDTRYESPEIE